MRKKTKTAQTTETPYTENVPALGKRLLNLGRSASYQAAKTGDIPTVRIGGKLLGLARVLEARLTRDPKE
jgi:hypothetical protein